MLKNLHMKKHIIFLLFLSFFLSVSAQETDNYGFVVKVGDQAPDFSASLSNGTIFKLSDYRGKIVMLQFTASWCSVCRKEMPYIEKDIWEVLKDKGFVLVGIDRDEPLDIVLAYQKKMEITYPLALDPNADIFGLYADKQSGVTRNVIINKKGQIIYLSRLFKLDEFTEMTKVIKEAVAKLN